LSHTTDIVSSLSPLRSRLSSGRRRHAAAPCRASFSWSQDKLNAFASSSDNTSSCHLSSQTKTEVLNPHHRCRPPFPDRPTPTIHYYKKAILIFVTLFITQSRLHFAFYSRSTTLSELYPLLSFSFTATPRLSSLRTTTPTVIN
jgi:hypothetical protein